jgi:hypothetical protein
MLKVTFEFKTPEEAITAIAKIAGLGAAAPAPRLEVRKQPTDIEGESRREPDAVQPKRGQRADKGKKRGPYKDREQSNAGTTATEATTGVQETLVAPGAAASAPETAAPQPSTAASSAAPSQEGVGQGGSAVAVVLDPALLTGTATTIASEADVQKALEKVFGAKGLPAAQAVLSKFGVSRGRDLAPEKRAEFIQAAEEVCK